MHPSLITALNAWLSNQSLRTNRLRNRRFTFGQQWDEPVTLPEGNTKSELRFCIDSGFRPSTNNLIRQFVKCVIGNFRSQLLNEVDPALASSPAPHPEIAARNSLTELDARMLEEFLISGCAIQRIDASRRLHGDGIWIDNVSPSRFFVNPFFDPRGLDINVVGMIHSLSLSEIYLRFATTPERRQAIDNALASPPVRQADTFFLQPSHEAVATSRFFTSSRSDRHRIIEVWTLEPVTITRVSDPSSPGLFVTRAPQAQIRRYNKLLAARSKPALCVKSLTSMRWHCRFFTSSGYILSEFDSPFPHAMHPFAIKFYPLVDGQVHSFVEDMIEQQRFINRLITLMDHILSISAKGALLFPVDQRPDDVTWEKIATLWAKCDSIIPYNPTHSGVRPEQIIGSGNNAGASQLLDIQLSLIERVSGIGPALQGLQQSPGESAALFDSRLRSQTIALLDLLHSFHHFRAMRNNLIQSTL